ncbi:MAG TPA: DUF4861 domain-containing protein [bacterium]|nr:DUF4861 domain-containing protein [bacterium]
MDFNKILVFCVLCSCFLVEIGIASDEEWYTEGNFEPSKRVKITLFNPLDIDRKHCPVVIERARMPVKNIPQRWITVVDPSLPPNPEPTKEQLKEMSGYLLRKETNGHFLVYQQDDIDKDGIWDELFFITDIKARETKDIYIYIDKSERGLYEHKTHAGIGYYGRHMVPFWESELMGWKLWFPASVDLHGKRDPMLTAYPEYSTNLSGYYMPWKYGTDIMTVSSTFGSGGICLFELPAEPDSVSRPNSSPDIGKGPLLDTRYSFNVVINGPLRSMIRANTMSWNSGLGQYELEQLYTAYAHKSYSTCEVKFTKFLPTGQSTEFGCGIREMMSEYETYQKDGIIISLGKNVEIRIPDEDIGDEGLMVDFEGIAIVVKDEYKPIYKNIKGFGGNHVLKIPVTSDHSFEYMIAGGWSEGSVNTTAEEFKNYIIEETLKYNNPLVIRVYEIEGK